MKTWQRRYSKWITIARSNFINMKNVLATRKLKWDTRMRLVRCYILSTLLYASETWVLNAETEGLTRSLEMWIYRRMLKISYQQHISNESFLVGLNVKPQLMKMIKERKCRYFVHIVRGERYEYQRLLPEGTVDGKRGRGRPRNNWFSNITDWMGIDHATAVRKAQDRDQWQSMVSKVPVIDMEPVIDWLNVSRDRLVKFVGQCLIKVRRSSLIKRVGQCEIQISRNTHELCWAVLK